MPEPTQEQQEHRQDLQAAKDTAVSGDEKTAEAAEKIIPHSAPDQSNLDPSTQRVKQLGEAGKDEAPVDPDIDMGKSLDVSKDFDAKKRKEEEKQKLADFEERMKEYTVIDIPKEYPLTYNGIKYVGSIKVPVPVAEDMLRIVEEAKADRENRFRGRDKTLTVPTMKASAKNM